MDYKCEFEIETKLNYIEVVSSPHLSLFPFNKILLNPVLTDKAIKEGKLMNYSDPELAAVTPPFFKEFIPSQKESCKFTVKIKPEEDIEYDINNYNIPLLFPEGGDLICSIPKIKAKEESTIECLIDGIIDEMIFVFQRTNIMEGNKIIAVIDYQFSTHKITCMEQLKDKSEKQLETTFSFRQAFNYNFPKYTANNFTLYTLGRNYSFTLCALETNDERKKDIDKTYENELLGNFVIENDKVEKTNVNIPCICYPGFYIVECLCRYQNNYSKGFNSTELKSSEILSGVPRYRLLKNPTKAARAFYNELIYDIGSYTNYFIAEEINGDNCRDNGEFYISGKFKDNGNHYNKNNNEFILFLTYPIEAKAKCSAICDNTIKCVSGSYFNQKEIMIEQQEVFDVYINREFFGITSIKSKKPLTCIIGTIDIPTEDEIIQYITDLHRTDIEEIIVTEKSVFNDTIEETSENSNIPEEIPISQKETIERNKPDTEAIPPVEPGSEKESYKSDITIISPEKSESNEFRDDEPSTKEKAQKNQKYFYHLGK